MPHENTILGRYRVTCDLVFDAKNDEDSQMDAAHRLADLLAETGLYNAEIILGENYEESVS